MNILIRRARKSDMCAIDQLSQEFAVYLHNLGCTYQFQFNGKTFLRDGFDAFPAFICFVATKKDRVIGYVLGHMGYDADAAARNFHIADLFVTAKYRRRSVGLQLVQKIAAYAAKSGAHELIWAIFKRNRIAEEFYRYLGGKKIRRVNFMFAPLEKILPFEP